MWETILRDELKKMIDRDEDFTLVDVLSSRHFEEEHIKGAINCPADEIEGNAKTLFNENDKIVVYCSGYGCTASHEAARKLVELGYKNVWRFEGGINEWKKAGYPLEGRAYVSPKAA